MEALRPTTAFTSNPTSSEVAFIQLYFAVLERTFCFTKFCDAFSKSIVKFINGWVRNAYSCMIFASDTASPSEKTIYIQYTTYPILVTKNDRDSVYCTGIE